MILHRTRPEGLSFKFLGVLFDPKLQMHVAIGKLATEAGWRLTARTALVRLFKAQVLSYLEGAGRCDVCYRTRCAKPLDRLDRILRRFLREIGHSDATV